MSEIKNNRKALIIDSSGIHPWLFAIGEEYITPDILDTFLQELGADCFLSDKAKHEFSTLSYTPMISLFAEPIKSVGRYDAVYLSDAGYLTTTVNSGLQITAFAVESIAKQLNLWETSKEWSFLSEEDHGVIQTARELVPQYSFTAILTNDWNLRQQSALYEGIEARGTCSMIAGLSLGGYISYQLGTYIFRKWLTKEPRWIPTSYLERRKFTFREVLEKERKLRAEEKSFWSP